VRCTADRAEAATLLQAELAAGDVALFKASRGVQLDRLVDALVRELAPPPGSRLPRPAEPVHVEGSEGVV
jgi:hypothetical protein